MELHIKKLEVVFSISLFISIVLWSFFLGTSQVTVQSLGGIGNIWLNISRLTSINFILFLIFFPFSYAIIAAMCRRVERKKAGLIALLSFLPAFGISFLFPNMLENLLLYILFFFSLFVAIETASIKYQELKKFIVPRATGSAAGAATGVLVAGIFLLSAFTMLPNNEAYAKELDGYLFSYAGGMANDIADASTELSVKSQVQTIDAIIATRQYAAVADSNDREDIEFAAAMNYFRETVSSGEYKERLKSEMREKSSGISWTDFNLIGKIKERVPLFPLIEEFYWLLASFAIASSFAFIGSIIIKPLAIIYGTLIDFMAGLSISFFN